MLLSVHLLLLLLRSPSCLSPLLSFLLWLLMFVVYSLRCVRCGHSLCTPLSTPQLRSPVGRSERAAYLASHSSNWERGACAQRPDEEEENRRTEPPKSQKTTSHHPPNSNSRPPWAGSSKRRTASGGEKAKRSCRPRRILGSAVAAAVLSALGDWLTIARRRALGFVGGSYCGSVEATLCHWLVRTAVEKGLL